MLTNIPRPKTAAAYITNPPTPLSSIWDGCFVDVVRILSVAVLLVHRVENTMVAFSDES